MSSQLVENRRHVSPKPMQIGISHWLARDNHQKNRGHELKELTRGTRFGPMVVAGQSTNSNLLVLVKHQADPSIAMPRSQTPGKPSEWLLPEQINLIETWINQGAKNN
jgi:hypothetical protein